MGGNVGNGPAAQAPNFELAVQTANINSRELVELCAPCHSHAAGQWETINTPKRTLLDNFLPSLLTEGQCTLPMARFMDEVYVYGSFTQSKMYRHDVRCSDCHDVHSIELVKEGNELCLQCHRGSPVRYGQNIISTRQENEAGDPITIGSKAKCCLKWEPARNASSAICRAATTWAWITAPTTASGSPTRRSNAPPSARRTPACAAILTRIRSGPRKP